MAQKSNTDTGSPANTHPADGTGIPSQIKDGKMQEDQRLTDAYTDNDNDIAEGTRTMHPNRNENKGNATGIDGYRN